MIYALTTKNLWFSAHLVTSIFEFLTIEEQLIFTSVNDFLHQLRAQMNPTFTPDAYLCMYHSQKFRKRVFDIFPRKQLSEGWFQEFKKLYFISINEISCDHMYTQTCIPYYYNKHASVDCGHSFYGCRYIYFTKTPKFHCHLSELLSHQRLEMGKVFVLSLEDAKRNFMFFIQYLRATRLVFLQDHPEDQAFFHGNNKVILHACDGSRNYEEIKAFTQTLPLPEGSTTSSMESFLHEVLHYATFHVTRKTSHVHYQICSEKEYFDYRLDSYKAHFHFVLQDEEQCVKLALGTSNIGPIYTPFPLQESQSPESIGFFHHPHRPVMCQRRSLPIEIFSEWADMNTWSLVFLLAQEQPLQAFNPAHPIAKLFHSADMSQVLINRDLLDEYNLGSVIELIA